MNKACKWFCLGGLPLFVLAMVVSNECFQNATGDLSLLHSEKEYIEEKDVKSRVMTVSYSDGTTKQFSCLRKNKADKLLCEN